MNQDLVDYIKQQSNLQVSKNKITDILLGQGWQQAELDEAFAIAEGVKSAPAKPVEDTFDESENAGRENSGPKFGRQTILLIVAGVAALAILAAAVVYYLPTETNPPAGSDSLAGQPATPASNASVTVQNGSTDNAPPANTQTQDNSAILASVNELEDMIQEPAGWLERKGTARSRPVLAFFKPEGEKDASGNVIFNENVNITRDSITGTGAAGAADYLVKAKQALQSKISGYKIVTDRKVKLASGQEATLVSGSFDQDGVAMRNMQLFAFQGDNVYMVTGVVLAANWDKEKDMIGAAVMSLKLPGGN